jgi:hypothetical protein
MHIKQISVFLENQKGRLAEVGKVLKNHHINIRALTVADTADFGILRMIVNQPDQAYAVLKKEGFTVKESLLVAVELDDREGIFYDLMQLCDDRGLNIEYLYSFVEQYSNQAILFMRFADPAQAVQVLAQRGFKVLSDEEVRKI